MAMPFPKQLCFLLAVLPCSLKLGLELFQLALVALLCAGGGQLAAGILQLCLEVCNLGPGLLQLAVFPLLHRIINEVRHDDVEERVCWQALSLKA